MKLYRLLSILLAWTIFACNPDSPDRPLGEYETGVLIANEGAFGANDGEVFHYEPGSETLKTNIFETVNGRPFAGLLQSMVVQNERLYLVANTGKVEVVDPKDFKSIGAVTTDLVQPRALATSGTKSYIADWGPYDANFNNPNSYIAVVNSLDGGSVTKKITVPSRPESLYADANFLYVANQAAEKLTIISTGTDAIVGSEDILGTPEKVQIINGRLYLYARDAAKVYFHEINRGNQKIILTKEFSLPNATANFAIGERDELYIITSSGWPDYNDAVAKINLETEKVIKADWHTGSGFYGIGFDPNTKQVFLANHAGFTGNGTVSILNANGQETKKLNVGRGPNGFLFK
jgi:DNA-binding beta-propeller fold protein YncE